MTRSLRAFLWGRDGEAGQAIVLIAITLLGMLMMVGIAIDAGELYSARRSMQEAADAAAYAGSVTRYQGGLEGDGWTAATADATRNGFTDFSQGGNASVTVRRPQTAPYNTSDYIEVIIQRNVRTSLVPAQAGITTVTVHAISGSEPFNNEYALIALDRNPTANALTSGPTANITLRGGGIMVNSSGTPAASSSTPAGNWTISCTVANPCQVDVVGSTSGTFPAANPAAYYNGVFTGRPPIADPFAGYPKPSTSGMATNPAGFGPGNNTLGSGIYTTALSNKKLCHGNYILKAGVSGSLDTDTTSTDPATGQVCDGKVFIFNTLSNYPGTGGTCGAISIAGNSEIDSLRPMTTGTYAGMLIYQDPACTQTMLLAGSAAEMDVTGTIYLPNAQFRLTGHAEVQGGQIVAKTVDLGNGEVDLNFTASTSARPVLPRLAK